MFHLEIQAFGMSFGIGTKASSASIAIGNETNYSNGISLAVKTGIGQTAGTEMLEVNGSISAKTSYKSGKNPIIHLQSTTNFTLTSYSTGNILHTFEANRCWSVYIINCNKSTFWLV